MKTTLALFAVLLPTALRAAAEPVDFVRDVRPIFEKNCYSCHGAQKQKSGLRLDVKAAALKGGDGHGALLVAGKAADSVLMKLVSSTNKDERMPPQGAGLSADEVATLTRWINQGAPWPEGVDTARLEDKRDHWSFKPLTNPAAPAVKNKAWPRGEIDRFVLARLEKAGLQPSPEASRAVWLRRASFDLTGLPPAPESVAAFENDKKADAYERAVDALLASPRYGERWAQQWLDVVRYADTHGFEVNTERPNAWPYRDYVIRAFNNDTPYDRFVKEQLVGDALGADAATGFLVTASVLLPAQIGRDEPSKRLARQDALDEIVNNVGQTFLGLSVGCARCHDHKFDPIPQRDYYAMQAFVAGVEYGHREVLTPEIEAARKAAEASRTQLAALEFKLAGFVPPAGSGTERAMINAKLNTERFAPTKAKRVRFTVLATNNLEPCIDEIEVFNADGVNVALASAGAVATASGSNTAPGRHELKFVNDGAYGNSRSWMSNETGKGWVEIEFAQEQTIDRVQWGRDRNEQFKDRLAIDYRIEVASEGGELRPVAEAADRKKFDAAQSKPVALSAADVKPEDAAEVKRFIEAKRPLETIIATAAADAKIFAGTFRKPDVIHLLSRGDPEQPKDEVQPAALSALTTLTLPLESAEQQRRRALADWIADPSNPLTARVMVNRIWQGHFGAGFVETPSDFGRSGLKPSHPELLDWLSSEFIRGGWSIKHLHKLIVLSATYRQRSAVPERSAAAAKDADVRLLWRYPSRRLEAETLRDTMLGVSGQLNLTMYGRGFDLFDQRGGLTGFKPVESFTGDGLRRMVYAHKVRRERDAVFGAFDCPDAGQSTARRRESTTPIQALNLFNSRFTLEQSQALAQRVQKDAGADPALQIRRAYELVLGRAATAAEVADAEPVVRQRGLAPLCRALFNSNEFLFLP